MVRAVIGNGNNIEGAIICNVYILYKYIIFVIYIHYIIQYTPTVVLLVITVGLPWKICVWRVCLKLQG